MTVKMKNRTFYRTSEAAQKVGIGRSTLLRWIKNGIIEDSSHRDRRGWRLFTQADVKRIEQELHKLK